MKKKLILLVMLVSILALSFTFLSCEDPKLELNGTTWVFGYSKADVAASQKITEATLDAQLSLAGITVNWPIPAQKIEFTSDKDFKLYDNSGLNDYAITWVQKTSGTYTIDGDDVTLKVGVSTLTCSVDGNTLTVTYESGTTAKFQKQ